MSARALYMRGRVFEPAPASEYAGISLRFASEDHDHPIAPWYITAQRNKLTNVGRWAPGDPYAVTYEADRILADTARACWDVLPGFGVPYGFRMETPLRGGETFAAFVAALPGHDVESVGALLDALRASRRVKLHERWTFDPRHGDPVPVYNVEHEQRGHAARWASLSSAVLAARADLAARAAADAREREERERARADEAREAC